MKFGRKDFQLAFKTGTDANKAKFKKECVQGEIYHATDTGFFYVAEVTAGASDATLSKFGEPAFSNGYSLSFDGVDDGLSCDIPTTLMATDFTTSMWVRLPASNVADGALWENNYDVSGKIGWRLYFASTSGSNHGILSVWVSNGSGDYHNPFYTGASDTLLGNDIWSNIVWGRNSGTHFLYVNGSQPTLVAGTQGFDSSSSNFSSTPALKINPTNIGTGPFQGYVDECAIWNVALSSSEIASIRDTSGTNPVPSDLSSLGNSGNGPIVWWRMGDDNTSGSTISNAQNPGTNDATFINAPTLSTQVPS